MLGGAIAYRSKTQSVTALSSTEAEFYAAVSAAKACLFLRHVLHCLKLPPTGPTNIYEDNEACINVINARHPTERTRHIETPYFRIQDWKDQDIIKMIHVSGTINNSDDLTKSTGWVLHSRHCRRTMGHYRPTY